jgi:hypothetical protein
MARDPDAEVDDVVPSRLDARARQALFVALCAGSVAFCLAFVAPAFTPMRVLWYLPLEHRWTFVIKPEGLGMDFYGRVLDGVLAGAVGTLAAWAIARRLRALSAGTLVLWTAWLTTAALLAMALFTYQMVRRHPRPLPIPAWYERR